MTGYQPIVIPFNYPGILAEVVGFEPTDPFEPSVFKTAALSHAQPYFLNLEQRVRFELTVLRICNPLHWTSLPPLHYWYQRRESNPIKNANLALKGI